tara:strand:- start:708 stop:965 length:258 start_codon:yes stop_codon:yes gene_type:complete
MSDKKLLLLRRLLQEAEQKSVTNFEYNSRKEALELLTSLYSTYLTRQKNKQLIYLLENDTMSDEEWELYIMMNFLDLETLGQESN